jgi:hypothetical protein
VAVSVKGPRWFGKKGGPRQCPPSTFPGVPYKVMQDYFGDRVHCTSVITFCRQSWPDSFCLYTPGFLMQGPSYAAECLPEASFTTCLITTRTSPPPTRSFHGYGVVSCTNMFVASLLGTCVTLHCHCIVSVPTRLKLSSKNPWRTLHASRLMNVCV